MLPFVEVLRLLSELEGEKTPENFHILPNNDECWKDIVEKAKERNIIMCLEFTGEWSAIARRTQRHFVRLADKTNFPFLRVEIPRISRGYNHEAVREAVGGVKAIPAYAILNFLPNGRVAVYKFEGSTALESGEFENRLARVVAEKKREQEARVHARVLGELFSSAFAAAEIEDLKRKKREQEKQEREEREERARRDEMERLRREEAEKSKRLREIEREQERRAKEEERRRNRPANVERLLAMNVDESPPRDIKGLMERLGVSYQGCTTRDDLITQLAQHIPEFRMQRERKQQELQRRSNDFGSARAEDDDDVGEGLSSRLMRLSLRDVKTKMRDLGISPEGFTSKEDMVQAIVEKKSPRQRSEHVSFLKAQHLEEKLDDERAENSKLRVVVKQYEDEIAQLKVRVSQTEKLMIKLEEKERELTKELHGAKLQKPKAAAAAARTRDVSNPQQGRSNFENESSEDRVRELERMMLDMTILFTTKAEDYDVLKLVNCGCDGAVHLVQCTRSELGDLDRKYALKTIFNALKHETMSKVRLEYENEYQVLASLPKHRNIVNLYAFFYDRLDPKQFKLPPDSQSFARSMSLFMVMEYQPNSLGDCVSNKSSSGGIKSSEILSWTHQLLTGVDFLSSHSVVHRDLKLDNVLVSDDGTVKICDFGHAIQLDVDMKMPLTPGVSKGGNPAHLAPEIHNARTGRGRSVDYSKQSVWAVGVLCYEMCNHGSPFGGSIDQAGYDSSRLPPLSFVQTSRGPGERLPPQYDVLVKGLLDFEPSERPTAAEALLKIKSMLIVPKLNQL